MELEESQGIFIASPKANPGVLRAALVDKTLDAVRISGGTVYDALIVRAAVVARADELATLNESHFSRLAPHPQDPQALKPLFFGLCSPLGLVS